MQTLADYINQQFGVPSPGAVNDKLIQFYSKLFTGSGSPVGSKVGPGFYFDLTNSVMYTNPNADNTSWTSLGGGVSSSLGLYGDGSDGAVTFDGAATVLGMAPASNVYTMTRDIFCSAITINNGVTLKSAGFRIYCSGTLTNNGIISGNGNAAVNGTAGAGAQTSSPGNSLSGNLSPVGQAGGVGTTSGAGTTPAAVSNVLGGQGGNAGAGSAGAAGSGGTVSSTVSPRSLPQAALGYAFTLGVVNKIAGGTGGGGASGDGSNQGGGGGGGAGAVLICASKIAGTGTISANGGNGGNSTAGNTGGGGGGGGGWIIVVSTSVSAGAIAGQTLTVTGGTHGTKQGTGLNGGDGAAGSTILLNG